MSDESTFAFSIACSSEPVARKRASLRVALVRVLAS